MSSYDGRRVARGVAQLAGLTSAVIRRRKLEIFLRRVITPSLTRNFFIFNLAYYRGEFWGITSTLFNTLNLKTIRVDPATKILATPMTASFMTVDDVLTSRSH